jgi:hypothetical protein
MPVSPSIQNYHIGKGIVSFKEDGATAFLDLGNAPSFIWTPTIAKKEHFSSREGIKVKDFTAITQVGATIKMTLDEINAPNLGIFTLGEVGAPDVDGSVAVSAFKKTEIAGIIKVEGTNDVGQHVDFTGRISVNPSGDFKLITDSDDFTTLEIEAEVQKDDTTGDFGVFTVHEPAGGLTTHKVRAPA